MSLYAMGAQSAANKETRILRLKAYLNTVSTENYNSLIALREKAQVYSWKTLESYLHVIKSKYGSTLTKTGKANLIIAKREATYLAKVQQKAKNKQYH